MALGARHGVAELRSFACQLRNSVPGTDASEDPENWIYLGNVPDVTHDFKDYVEPLTQEQMEKLKAPYSE